MADGRFCLVGPLDQYAVPFKTATVMVPIIALLASVVMGSTGTKDHFVPKVQALGEIRCNFHDEGSSPNTLPCSDFKPPAKVAIGESFSAEGLRRTIRFIVATQAEEDYNKLPNWSVEKAQYFCVAAETHEDLGEGQPHRIWLFIPRCVPAL
jgi:hypothetical protein